MQNNSPHVYNQHQHFLVLKYFVESDLDIVRDQSFISVYKSIKVFSNKQINKNVINDKCNTKNFYLHFISFFLR